MLDKIKELFKLDAGIVIINENLSIAKIEYDDHFKLKFNENGITKDVFITAVNDVDYILENILQEYKSFYKMIGAKQVIKIQEEIK